MRDLMRPEQLARRLILLDELDAIIGGQDLKANAACQDPQIIAHANAIKCELEAANEELY